MDNSLNSLPIPIPVFGEEGEGGGGRGNGIDRFPSARTYMFTASGPPV